MRTNPRRPLLDRSWVGVRVFVVPIVKCRTTALVSVMIPVCRTSLRSIRFRRKVASRVPLVRSNLGIVVRLRCLVGMKVRFSWCCVLGGKLVIVRLVKVTCEVLRCGRCRLLSSRVSNLLRLPFVILVTLIILLSCIRRLTLRSE